MTIYKISGRATSGNSFRFLVECENDLGAKEAIIEHLSKIKLTVSTITAREATPSEIQWAKSYHGILVAERVGA